MKGSQTRTFVMLRVHDHTTGHASAASKARRIPREILCLLRSPIIEARKRAVRAVASVRVVGSTIRPILLVFPASGMRPCYSVGVIALC